MNRRKTLPLLVSSIFYHLSSKIAHAAPSDDGNNDWTGDCVAEGDVATIRGLECIVPNLLEPLPYIIGLVAFLMVIFAGARIISAGADSKALDAAWSQFRWALIGIVLLAVAWLILLTIEQFTGAKVTSFGFD